MEWITVVQIQTAINSAFNDWVIPNIPAILTVTFIGVAISIVLNLLARGSDYWGGSTISTINNYRHRDDW